jgi:cytochrome c-type biogenesis protein CcmF
VAAIVGITAALGFRVAMPAFAFAASTWLILGAMAELVERIRLFRIPLGASLARARSTKLSVYGAALAHAGMGVTVAGIAGMALASQSIVALHVGESTHMAGYTWTLEGLHDAQGPNYVSRIATVAVDRGGDVLLLEPSRRRFVTQPVTTTDAAIRTNFLYDIYVVLGEERDGAAILRLHFNPLAPWIWLGGLVMAAGGGLSLIDRRLRVGAPVRSRLPAVPA